MLPLYERLFDVGLFGETGISASCLCERGCLRQVLPVRLTHLGLANIGGAVSGHSRRPDENFGALPIPKRGCLRPVAPARVGLRDLAYKGEAV